MQNILTSKERIKSDFSILKHSETAKGQIYTRPEVVEFMLTVIGLNTCDDLEHARILEPSCGEGEFVIAIVNRLINTPKKRPTAKEISNKLLAVDLDPKSIEVARDKVSVLLESLCYSKQEIDSLLNNWFICTDFLLEDIEGDFSHVIGNPPYVRVENISKSLLDTYRRLFATMTDRADLYIPFYEKSLSLLKNGGKLSFVCTDRWTKNKYGKMLRKLISESYSLELFVDLYEIDAFEKDVMTYPAITQLSKRNHDGTILKHKTIFSREEALDTLAAVEGRNTNIKSRKKIVNSDRPWLLGSSEQTDLIQRLEYTFPLLEEVGCKVFIGAATGANKIYIVDLDEVGSEIEKSRLLPVITANDLKSGSIKWRGKYLINTYDHEGVINLDDYPKLCNYLNKYKDILSKRHVAKKDSKRWFKTIDRVYEERALMEKLLIPDISNNPIVFYDSGNYHPNNSLYYICSEDWNLYALRAILLSGITKLFISSYSTKIAKGYLRFQAQHLRKLRLPVWDNVSSSLKEQLISAGKENNSASYTYLASEVYGLNRKEKVTLGL